MLTTTSTATTSPSCPIHAHSHPNITDALCGARIQGNILAVFDSCCRGDKPVKYHNDCAIYCLAQGQTVGDLGSCLTQKVPNHWITCNKPDNATATKAATTTKAPSASTSSSAPTHTNAAVLNQPVSKTGLGVLSMLFCSALMGAVA